MGQNRVQKRRLAAVRLEKYAREEKQDGADTPVSAPSSPSLQETAPEPTLNEILQEIRASKDIYTTLISLKTDEINLDTSYRKQSTGPEKNMGGMGVPLHPLHLLIRCLSTNT